MDDDNDDKGTAVVKTDDNNGTVLLVGCNWFGHVVRVVNSLVYKPIVNRNPPLPFQKLVWDEYCARFSSHPKFVKKHLRMPFVSFYKLLGYLRNGLEVDSCRAGKGGPILPEIALFCAIRWLAGGSYLDIIALTGVSVASFYRIVHRVIRLIATCDELSYGLPKTLAECESVADGFRSISQGDAIPNCIGAVDGYLLRIYTPPKECAGNVRSFYSGHYACSGVNIQALCDSKSRFLYLSVAAPGSVNDREAIKESLLLEELEKNNTPAMFVIIGDAAYEPSERLVPMFYGISRSDKECDNYNYFASQCRIRIEMAFGLMQMKWGLLWRPMRVKLKKIKPIMFAISRLHNFTINERLLNDELIEEVTTGDGRIYYSTDEDLEEYSVKAPQKYLKGISLIRDAMVERIKDLGLSRPESNRIRSNEDDNE